MNGRKLFIQAVGGISWEIQGGISIPCPFCNEELEEVKHDEFFWRTECKCGYYIESGFKTSLEQFPLFK